MELNPKTVRHQGTVYKRSELIVSRSSWPEYLRDPCGNTLRQLVSSTERHEMVELVIALAAEFASSQNWKISQHIALLLLDRGQITLAMYYAHKAFELSAGNLKAELILMSVYWERRLAGAITIKEDVLLSKADSWPIDSERSLLVLQVLDLMVRARAYLVDDESTERLFVRLIEAGGMPSEASCIQIIMGSGERLPIWIKVYVAHLLSQNLRVYGGRLQGQVKRWVQRGFLALLESRSNA